MRSAAERRGRFLGVGIMLTVCLLATADPVPVDSRYGTLTIEDRAAFEFYSQRANFPGAMQVREVKFLLPGVDTETPQLYFQNTTNYPSHYDFALDALGWTLDLSTFNRQTYFSDRRKNLAGSIIAHDHYEPNEAIQGIYTMEFWPTDPVSFEGVQLAYDLIKANMPFTEDMLFYHPPSETQRALYEMQRELFEASSIKVIQTEDLYENISYTALVTGEAYGRLRIIDGPDTVSARDIVVYRTIPNTLSHVAAIITEVPQTPLSHINLKAQQNHTPNAYIRDATTGADLLALAGQNVRLEIRPEGYILEEASQEEVNAFFESIRPTETQIPPRNLSVTEIAPLAAIGFADSNSFGVKAANIAELARCLPAGMVPDGFAVPFYFYDGFMKSNSFYDMATAMMADPTFQSDPDVRLGRLDRFRKTLRAGALPDWMLTALDAMHRSFDPNTSLRCRSSTNNEDLPDFNGAGLYDSYTHHPNEGHIAKSIKQVWAGLWTYRAFEEREFYRIDHVGAAMGVLVHPNFENEQANGVGVTKNIYDADWPGYYVNVQLGEDLVTNPQAYSIPDEFLVADLAGEERYEIQYVRRSNLGSEGHPILTQTQIFELADMMDLVQGHFKPLYGIARTDADFAMDIEFKITAEGRLSIKQARPWID